MMEADWRQTRHSATVQILADEFEQIHGQPPSNYGTYKTQVEDRQSIDKLQSQPSPMRADRTLYDDLLVTADKALCQDFHKSEQTALCLSGGGIRSAVFALGVIQNLTKNGSLHKFNYLSTVSGGGYIGAWLSTWIAKTRGGWPKVEGRLTWDDNAREEAEEIQHLRQNSRYLTQRSGLISGDTWAALVLWGRNLILNWLLIIPLIGAAVTFPKLLVATLSGHVTFEETKPFLAAALLFYAAAVIVMAYNRPRWTRYNLDRAQYIWMYQAPLIIAGIAWVVVAATMPPMASWSWFAVCYGGIIGTLYAGAWAFAATAWWFGPGRPLVYVTPCSLEQNPCGYLNYRIRLSKPGRRDVSVCAFTEDRQAVETIHFQQQAQTISFDKDKKETEKIFTVKLKTADPTQPACIEGKPITARDIRVLLREAKGAIIARTPWKQEAAEDTGWAFVRGAIVGVILATFHSLFSRYFDPKFVVLLGLPAALAAHLAGSICFAGLNNRRPKSENDREWHGRLDGFATAIVLLWIVGVLVDLFLPNFIYNWIKAEQSELKDLGKIYTALGSIGTGAGALVAWIGKGADSPATSEGSARSWRARLVLPVSGLIFIVCLVSLLSLVLDMPFGPSPFLSDIRERVADKTIGALPLQLFVLFAALLIFPMLLGTRVNVNRFSLHAMYRNRLIRGFMGASKDWYKDDAPDRFTGFQDSDNIEMQRLWDRRSGGGPLTRATWRPFHVVNMALNVLSGKNLALQDRKALPFVVTPLWCGSGVLDDGRGAFRRSSEFGGEEKTITVGTAMAISGAAVSPNMGYHSSPLISFLLTLFNVRLGWWYGNPLNWETYRLEGPRWAIKSLIYEAFGLTDEKRPYIYLSDGGHFDNLGLYEMIRRRCHVILVIDAGQDPKCGFEDLSNSLSRIKMDFGISISIDLKPIRVRNDDRLKPDEGGDGYATGIIRYADVDGVDAPDGTLLYLKPSFRGDEPTSILGYAEKRRDFPHENTVDQWFSEAQFESYRALGFEMMKRFNLR